MKKFTFPSLVLLFIFVIAFSCKPTQKDVVNPFDFVEVINAYGPQNAGKMENVFIDFKTTAVKSLDRELLKSAFSISPQVEGDIIIEGDHVLVFNPTHNFESATDYFVTIDLTNIVKDTVVLDQKEFTFKLKTIPQNASLEFSDLNADNGIWKAVATLRLNDKEELKDVERALTVTQDDRAIDFRLSPNSAYVFEIIMNEVNMDAENSILNVKLAKQPLDLKDDLSLTYELPDPSSFELVNALSNKNKVTFVFNKILDKNQNLNGLIKLDPVGSKPQYRIEGNKLVVFNENNMLEGKSISISEKIKNAKGQTLARELVHNMESTILEPKLKNVGLGHILPESDRVVFPFEAQGLKSVHIEIFKVYADNLQQFYQQNSTSSYYNLEFVGETVFTQEVRLDQLGVSYDPRKMNRYYFDLKSFVAKEKNALYEIRIGFSPEDLAFECPGMSYNMETVTDSYFDQDYYGLFGYYEGYKWQDREDPCKLAFYNYNKFISKLIMTSNLGVIAKKSSNGDLFVAVNDIITTLPVSGAEINIYNKAQRLLLNSTTDSKGMLFAQDVEDAFQVQIKKNTDENWIRVAPNDALSLSKFDVSGRTKEKGLDGMIYGERNIWRPGDSLFLDFILFDSEGKLPKDHPVKITVQDPQGKLVYSHKSISHNGPIYPFTVPSRRDFLTGDYVATAYVGSVRFSKFFKLENIKPNKFAIQSDLSTAVLEDARSAIYGSGMLYDFQVDWLYGAPAKNKKLTVQLDIDNASTTFKQFSAYQFVDPRNDWNSPAAIMLSESKTNEEGTAKVKLKLNSDMKPKGKLALKFKSTAYEDSGDFSADVFSVPFSPYDSYVGINMPRDDYDYKRTGKDETTKIDFVAVTDQGKVMDTDLSVRIYKMENYWWYSSYNNDFDMTNLRSHISQHEYEINTGSDGKASISTTFRSHGRYYVQACDNKSGHCTGDYIYVGYSWDDDEMSTDQYEEAAQLTLKTEKPSFGMGETVEVIVPSYFEGNALVSLENGDKIVESFWTKVQRGNNKINFTSQLGMFPTVFVHVTLLQEFADKANDMPIRLYGVIPVTIEDKSLLLEPKIKMSDELKPKETFQLEVSENNGKAMYYTVAVVDEGLLNISRFKTPDPFNHFYSRPSLGVRTFDNYNDVMSAYGAELSGLFSIGGDGENIAIEEDARANRFKPVVQHLGPFFVGSGAKKVHKITLPNYIGSVRIMVVAANEKSFGSSQKNVPVKQDLMVMATMPRSLSIGDKVDLPLTIFGLKENLGNVDFGAESKSNLLNFERKNGSTNFSVAEEKLERLSAEVGMKEGVENIGFFAKNRAINSTQEIEIDVVNPNPIVRRSEQKFVEAGASLDFQVAPIGLSGSTVITSASSLFPVNVKNVVDRLARYPYGCLEQRTSAALAMLYAGDLTAQTELEKNYSKAVVTDLLGDLYRFQNIRGYSLWPGSSNYHDWLSNYIGDFIFQAQEKGYNIPASALSHWKSSQISRASDWSVNKTHQESYQNASVMTQAYRLYTLAQMGEPQFSEMNRLREDFKLGEHAALLLGAAYAIAGRQDIASEIVKSSTGNNSNESSNAYTFGSEERNAALQVIMLERLGDKEKTAKQAKNLTDLLLEKNYLSTQSSAFVIRALAIIAKDFGTSKDVSINYEETGVVGKAISSETGNVAVQTEIQSAKTITVKNLSSKGVYVEVVRIGKEDINSASAGSSQLSIKTQYLDMAGKTIDPSKLSQGTDFKVLTTVYRPKIKSTLYNDLVLRQIFPAGWEITNNRIFDFGQSTNSDLEYQDFKDNQVNSFFSLRNNEQIVIETLVKATYSGRFLHPKMISESMYRNDIYAELSGFTTEVITQ